MLIFKVVYSVSCLIVCHAYAPVAYTASCVLYQSLCVMYALRVFRLIVSDHDESFVLTRCEGVDDIHHQTLVHVVKPVQGLIEHYELRVFDESPDQQYEPLLTARQLEEVAPRLVAYPEHVEPEKACLPLLGGDVGL